MFMTAFDQYQHTEQFPNHILSFSLKMLSSLSGVPDYFGRNKISSGGDLSHYSSASLY